MMLLLYIFSSIKNCLATCYYLAEDLRGQARLALVLTSGSF